MSAAEVKRLFKISFGDGRGNTVTFCAYAKNSHDVFMYYLGYSNGNCIFPDNKLIIMGTVEEIAQETIGSYVPDFVDLTRVEDWVE